MERPKGPIMSESEKERATTIFENRKEFKGAVIGMVLGDGSLSKPRTAKQGSHLIIGHSKKQEGYALYKAEILKWLTAVTVAEYDSNYPKDKDIKLKTTRVTTRNHPMYSKLRERFYYQDRKTVTEHLMKMLTPMGIALWYQDDGCFAYHGGYQEVYLNTQGFNLAENELMSRHLQKRFGLQIRVNRAQGKYYCLRLRRKDRQKFIDLVSPFISECMKYKVEITDKWDDLPGTRQHEKMTVTCILCGKTYERYFKEGNKYLFCGDCWMKRRVECKDFSNNNGADSEFQSQDIVCSA